jgi:hypothetical protein
MNTQNYTSLIFKKQLRELMPKLDKVADRMARLRHYIAGSLGSSEDSEQERLVQAGNIIARWKAEGIPQNHFYWMMHGGGWMSLSDWWQGQVSSLRSKVAKSSKVAKVATRVSTKKGKRRY